jgi:hypothetical protein
MEGSLLTVADVGGRFVEEFRGEVGVSGGGVCPESDFGFDDVGMVRAAFVWPLQDDVQVELVQMVRVGETGELVTMFAEMDKAFDACSGVVWTDYGETQVAEVVEVPEVGDDRLALHEVHGDPPFDGRHDDIRTVYVRSGDVFVEISASQTLDSSDDQPSLSDEEFERIVGLAVEKLN